MFTPEHLDTRAGLHVDSRLHFSGDRIPIYIRNWYPVPGIGPAAINAGYTVTTHENPISVPGWTGSGYIIADHYGNGMYMISGGENGGVASTAASGLFSLTALSIDLIEVISRAAKAAESFKSFLGPFGQYLSLATLLLDTITIVEKCSRNVGIALFAILSVVAMIQLAIVPLMFALVPGIGAIAGMIITGLLNTMIATYLNDFKEKVLSSC